MIFIKVICVGSIKEQFFKECIKKYSTIISKKNNFVIIEVSDEKIPENSSEKQKNIIKNIEGKKILSKIATSDFVINLCINGKELSSKEFKKKINEIDKNIVFVIGGSLGLSDEVLKRGNFSLSFSNLTFPHQLMRVALLEQISSNLC